MMIRSRTLPVVIILFAALSQSLAQGDPCAQFKNTAEQSDCANRQLQSAEHDLKLAFDVALRVYTESAKQLLPRAEQAGQVRWEKSMLKKLRDSQRAWLAYRGAACGTVEFMYEGGTINAVAVPLCKADLTVERTKFLRDNFGD